MTEVAVSLPPLIAERTPPVDSALATVMETAVREIVALDSHEGASSAALGVLLVRTESVASSKIENIRASWTTTPAHCTAARQTPPRRPWSRRRRRLIR